MSIKHTLGIEGWNPNDDQSSNKSIRSPEDKYVRPQKASRFKKNQDEEQTPGSKAFAQVIRDVLSSPKKARDKEYSMINIADSNIVENSNLNSPEMSQRIMKDPDSGNNSNSPNRKAMRKINATKGTGYNSKKNSTFAAIAKKSQLNVNADIEKGTPDKDDQAKKDPLNVSG